MLGIAMASVSTASPATSVIRVEPKNNTAKVGETFTVNITVAGIVLGEPLPACEGLYGWECRITFKRGVIHAVNATEGPFLKTSGYNTTWLPPKIDNEVGTITIGALLTPSVVGFPPNGAVGSGVLATVTFEVVGRGLTVLDFKEEEDAELWTVVYPSTINEDTTPIDNTAEDGKFSNAGPPISLNLVAGVVVVVAVCAVAMFYFRRKKASTGT